MASDIKSTDAFEAALKSELQRAASKTAEPGADCPAPDVLAAYYDRSLSRNERARVESHLLACARCQSMMAAIARADDSEQSHGREPARWIFWGTRLVAPIAVVGVVIAIAIGMRTREHPAPEVIALASPVAEMKGQLAEPAPAPPPPALPEAFTPSASQPAIATGVTISHKHHHRVGARKKAAAISSKSEDLAHEEVAKAEPQSALREYSTGSLPANPSSALAPSAAAPVARAAPVEVPSAPPNEAPVTGAAVPSIGAVSGAAPQAPERMAQARSAVQSPASGGAAIARSVGAMAEAPRLNQISSPDGSVAWQFGARGTIMRSGNSSPWLSMQSGVTADLLAASAPSNEVCWMVGRSGTIVRTLDSGAHWQIVRAPSRDDFTAISATDSNNATLIASDGQRYVTHDGGVTWSSP